MYSVLQLHSFSVTFYDLILNFVCVFEQYRKILPIKVRRVFLHRCQISSLQLLIGIENIWKLPCCAVIKTFGNGKFGKQKLSQSEVRQAKVKSTESSASKN